MKAEKDFALQVLDLSALVMGEIVPTMDKPSYSFGCDAATEDDRRPDLFYFQDSNGIRLKSDSITELAERVIGFVERNVNTKLKSRDIVYFSVLLPESQFDKYFTKQPNGTVAFYTDTFRRVIAKLRKEFGV